MGNSAVVWILPLIFAAFSLFPVVISYGKAKKVDASMVDSKIASNEKNPIIIDDNEMTIKLNLKNEEVHRKITEQLSSLR